MIDESLIKSNFIGRDGFRWWIGQIPPVDAWEGQSNGAGWGHRYKVRILGYHPYNERELSNEDLPWAGVLMPVTAGSGAANYAQNPKVRPGDVVIGFFLDGDNAQIPLIIGTFGRTDEVSKGNYESPFAPFTGYSDRIKNDGGKVVKSEANENKTNSQKSPRTLSQQQVQQLNSEKQGQNKESDERAASSAIGKTITFSDTCDDGFATEVSSLLGNLLGDIGEGQKRLQEIQSVTRKIQNLSNGLVGNMVNSLYKKLEPTLAKGLKLLYDLVYAYVYAITPGEHEIKDKAGQIAGCLAQQAMLIPISNLQKQIPKTSLKVIEGLGDTVSKLIESTIDQVSVGGICVAEQFTSSLSNKIVQELDSGLSGVLGGVDKILSLAAPGFQVASFLRGSASNIQGIGGLFIGGQNNSKCKKLSKGWVIGYGSLKSSDLDKIYKNVVENMNISSSLASAAGTINELQTSFTSPDCAKPVICGSPTVSFYDGDGEGATGKVILGNLVANTLQQVSSSLSKTASIIGVEIVNPGKGYFITPPLVSFADPCGVGYGAVGKAIVDFDKKSKKYGQVIGVYIISEGENYPAGSVNEQIGSDVATDDPTTVPYGVVDVHIVEGGTDYSNGDTARDDLGNTYALTIDNGKIIYVSPPINSIKTRTLPEITINSATGYGAILKPLIGRLPEFQGEVEQVIDCITK